MAHINLRPQGGVPALGTVQHEPHGAGPAERGNYRPSVVCPAKREGQRRSDNYRRGAVEAFIKKKRHTARNGGHCPLSAALTRASIPAKSTETAFQTRIL